MLFCVITERPKQRRLGNYQYSLLSVLIILKLLKQLSDTVLTFDLQFSECLQFQNRPIAK